MENSNTRWKTIPQKRQESNLLSTNPKENSHANIIQPLTTKIPGNSNHWNQISLNIYVFKFPIKIHRLKDWPDKEDQTFCYMQETHCSDKDRHYLRVKGWKTIFQPNCPPKQAGVAILISKLTFNQKLSKNIRKDTLYM